MNRKLKLEELKRATVAEFKSNTKHPVIVILDNIRSFNNVGSFFRTSDAFNVKELLLCGITAQPPHREIRKTAIGATESVDWKHFETTETAVNYAKELGYKTCAVEQAVETVSLEKIETPDTGIALVFGNEVDGVQDGIIAICDEVIEIPQFGTKHSLNVSVCGGAVLWEVTKKFIS